MAEIYSLMACIPLSILVTEGQLQEQLLLWIKC